MSKTLTLPFTNEIGLLYEFSNTTTKAILLGIVKTQALIHEWRTRKVNAMVAGVKNFIDKGSKMAQMVGAPVDMSEMSEQVRG